MPGGGPDAQRNQETGAAPFYVRRARPDELSAVRDVDVEAKALFRQTRHAWIADSEPEPLSFFVTREDAGLLWVATDSADKPVGHAAFSDLDGLLHLQQISVATAWQRRGVGRRILDGAFHFYRGRGVSRVTLTTFTDVPFNRPYYLRLGFADLTVDEDDPRFGPLFAHEAAMGLDMSARVAMVREL